MDSQSISINANSPLFQGNNDAFVEPPQDSNIYILYGFILLVVILVGAHYAGFNVFEHLGNATDAVGDIVFPIGEKIGSMFTNLMEMIGGGSVAESSEVGKVAVKGVKKTTEVIDEGADEIDKSLDQNKPLDDDSEIEEVIAIETDSKVSSSKKSKNGETPVSKASGIDDKEIDDLDIQIEDSDLKKSINKAKPKSESDREKVVDIKPNDVFTGVPRARPGNNKSGWCFIGTYSGYRSCSKVGEADKCMSGDIFPTHDVCVNPNLRA